MGHYISFCLIEVGGADFDGDTFPQLYVASQPSRRERAITKLVGYAVALPKSITNLYWVKPSGR